MADQDDETEKSFEPTAHKIQEARRKGDVAKSQDLNATASYIGLFIALSIAGTSYLFDSAQNLMVLLDQSAQLAPLFFEGRSAPAVGQIIAEQIPFLAMVFLVPMGAVVLSAIAQRSITFAPSKLAPKLNRISPISIAKQKFGPSGLFEFFKSFVKLVVISACLGLFIRTEINNIIVTPRLEGTQSMAYLGKILLNFLAIVIAVSAVIGALDYVFQYFEHRRKLMMSRKEIQDETKQNEGDPFVKHQRQQRGRELALSQTLKDVETADVVITNPTHYAVALHWSREAGSAPTCAAKGTDEVAKAIRQRAMEHGIPIHEDPPTARALHATTDVGHEIPHDLYQAVATAIRFADKIREKAKNGFM